MSANQQHPTPLRMPHDLKNWIKQMAAANRRSLNTEIVMMLELAKAEIEKVATMN